MGGSRYLGGGGRVQTFKEKLWGGGGRGGEGVHCHCVNSSACWAAGNYYGNSRAHIAGRLNSGLDRGVGAWPPHICYINLGEGEV
jgi:hypothetical protein